MSPRPVAPGAVAVVTLTLFSAAAFSVVAYPEIASRIHELLGGSSASGASLVYYRDFYVRPASLSFLVVSAVGIALAARRGRRALGIAAAASWLILLAGLVGSVEWYYATVRNAAELR